MKHFSKTKRESLLALLVLLILFIGSIALGNHFFRLQINAQESNYLENKINLLTEHFPLESVLKKGALSESERTTLTNTLSVDDERFTLLNDKGIILFDSGGDKVGQSRTNRPEIQSVLKGSSIGISLRTSPTLHKEMLYVAKSIVRNGKHLGIVRMASVTSKFSPSIVQFRNYMIAVLTVLFVGLGALILRLIRQKNEPFEVLLPILKNSLENPDKENLAKFHSKEMLEFYQVADKMREKVNQTTDLYQSTEEQFYDFIQELSIGVCFIDENQHVLIRNSALRKMMHLVETNGSKYTLVFQDPEMIQCLQKAILEEKDVREELYLSQSKKQVEVTIQALQESPTTIRWIVSAYDVTEFRRLEKQQSDFVGNVSHELKTPVTSLIGFTETLLDGAVEDKEVTKQFLEIMQKDALRLQHLISEILDLSRGVESIQEENSSIHLRDTFEELERRYQKEINAKHLSVQIIGDDNLQIDSKAKLFHPIVKNLFENAVSYSREGGELQVTYKMEGDQCVFIFKDNGIGMTKENQDRVFERFFRADKARTRNSGGTGLGLSIVKNNVELLGGSVQVSSQLGVGTTFTVTLPQ